jgi:Ca-activated chloride channel family protein
MAATLRSSQTKGTNGSSKPPPPPSEQAIAMDQWLRTIPDDSGELLQRKFMIEHLMKQRGNEP